MGPGCPEELEYLVSWGFQLYGRSGIGMEGVAPLSYATVSHWSELTDTPLEPYEVEALMRVDAAIRNPEEPEQVQEVEPVVAESIAWPTRKS